jgi:hypothetical protein
MKLSRVLVSSAALSLAFACSESPTETTTGGLVPSFKKCPTPGHPSCDDGGDPNSTTVAYDLLSLGVDPGVYGDGGSYEALRQDCLADPARSIMLVPPVKMPATVVIAETEFVLPPPPECPATGRVSIHLPGDELDPALDGDYGANEPSFTTNKNGKVRATGWMRPTFNLVWACGELEFCNFVWTDGFKETTGAVGSREVTITGSCARLYAGGLNTVPFEPDGVLEDDGICDADDGILGFLVAITVTVTEETQ